MYNKLVRKIYSYYRNILSEYNVAERVFKLKSAAGLVDISDWSGVYPDRQITSIRSIIWDKKFQDFSLRLHKERRILLSIREMWNLYNLVKKTQGIKGDIAEIGVYRGGSAKLICFAKGQRRLYLFDNFGKEIQVNSQYDLIRTGDIVSAELKDVRSYLRRYRNVYFYPGIFPTSITPKLSNEKFSFVHLDTDLYDSTSAGLIFFYPRISKRGIIMTHDYNNKSCPGVKKAFDDFFKDKPEMVVELWDTQAIIVKL
ncbi:TylF/MycF family methyltransferase [Patescibacteria group bacterium]|nr:TylF/MycF family methyltransferase [Patescibacteria group bacterium]MCL5409268.1 TylF/MycF family methyltransferase [Patescibacteria group bacterium]